MAASERPPKVQVSLYASIIAMPYMLIDPSIERSKIDAWVQWCRAAARDYVFDAS